MAKRKRMVIEKEKKHIFREYKPVIVATFILIILLVGLIFVFNTDITKIKEIFTKEEKEEKNSLVEEKIVDISYSKCSKEDIEKYAAEASKIKMTYVGSMQENGMGIVPGTDEQQMMYNYLFDITYENLTENLYMIIKDNDIHNYEAGSVSAIKFEDTDNGIYKFKAPFNINFVTYYVKIYTSDKTECRDETVRNFEFTTPLYNTYKGYKICNEDFMKEFKYCSQEVLTQDEFIPLQQFFSEATEFKIQKVKEETEEINNSVEEHNIIIEFIKNNLVMIGVILVIVIILLIVFIFNTRKNRRGDNNEV